MLRFSQRLDLTPVKNVIQVDSMDDGLRTGLWNILTLVYWRELDERRVEPGYVRTMDDAMLQLVQRLWSSYFKKPLDTIGRDWTNVRGEIKYYFFKCQWNEVYDLIEFISLHYPNKGLNQTFRKRCNKVLEQELSAYRFVGVRLVCITAEEEIAEVEQTLETPLTPVQNHLKKALDLLADRRNPDLRNSIKESICAVEAACRFVSGKDKATLGDALGLVEAKLGGMHPAFKKAFAALYGYTSDAGGIRHALRLEEQPDIAFEDAKFFMVACSAFVSFVLAKAAKAGIGC